MTRMREELLESTDLHNDADNEHNLFEPVEEEKVEIEDTANAYQLFMKGEELRNATHQSELLQNLRYKNAIQYYDRALSICKEASTSALILNNKGWCFAQLKRSKEALDCYKKGIIIQDDFKQLFKNILQLELLNNIDCNDVISFFDNLLIIKPPNSLILETQGYLHLQLSQIESALKCFENAILLNKSALNSALGKCICLILTGKSEDAFNYFKLIADKEKDRLHIIERIDETLPIICKILGIGIDCKVLDFFNNIVDDLLLKNNSAFNKIQPKINHIKAEIFLHKREYIRCINETSVLTLSGEE